MNRMNHSLDSLLTFRSTISWKRFYNKLPLVSLLIFHEKLDNLLYTKDKEGQPHIVPAALKPDPKKLCHHHGCTVNQHHHLHVIVATLVLMSVVGWTMPSFAVVWMADGRRSEMFPSSGLLQLVVLATSRCRHHSQQQVQSLLLQSSSVAASTISQKQSKLNVIGK